MEKTYIMIKPDGFKNTAEIKHRIKKAGFKVIAEKQISLTEELLRDHYDFLVDKPFFSDIVEYMTSDIVIGMIIEGENAVLGMRAMMGVTDPQQAAEGTIRRDFAESKSRNVIHGSDSAESAEKEIKRFFPELNEEKRIQYTFEVLPQVFSVCKVENYSQINLNKQFIFIGNTDNEKSLICAAQDMPKNTISKDNDYSCIRFAPKYELSRFIGAIAYVTKLFARNGVCVFVNTTNDTSFIFFKKRFLNKMLATLKQNGHAIIGE